MRPTRNRVYKLCFYVPESHLEAVKTAVFAAGAGRMGNYDCCCWQTKGAGQFRPLPGNRAFIGTTGTVETVDEVKVEMICAASRLPAAIRALTKAHPYETPAFDSWPVETRILSAARRSPKP